MNLGTPVDRSVAYLTDLAAQRSLETHTGEDLDGEDFFEPVGDVMDEVLNAIRILVVETYWEVHL